MEDVRGQVRDKMLGLVQGSIRREDVADGALALIKDEPADYSKDAALWTALDRLAGADLQRSPGVHLHGEEDFRSWLADLAND